ncbi:hypothetical protein [Paraflavitalea speifideaquila]|uniref:hypothetical protein n=1 Tax=Paraflavitalea speifideaquila TaxID=3076558 RepID=UPI0028ED8CC3|nr:hypothetical protein [Paraflavitalea speifideiaquila]
MTIHPDRGTDWELLAGADPHQMIAPGGQVYYRLDTGRLQEQLLMARACFMGKMKLLQNKKQQQQQQINQSGFGRGPVTVNLSNKQVLL